MPPLMHVATMMSVSLLFSLAVHSVSYSVYQGLIQGGGGSGLGG